MALAARMASLGESVFRSSLRLGSFWDRECRRSSVADQMHDSALTTGSCMSNTRAERYCAITNWSHGNNKLSAFAYIIATFIVNEAVLDFSSENQWSTKGFFPSAWRQPELGKRAKTVRGVDNFSKTCTLLLPLKIMALAFTEAVYDSEDMHSQGAQGKIPYVP